MYISTVEQHPGNGGGRQNSVHAGRDPVWYPHFLHVKKDLAVGPLLPKLLSLGVRNKVDQFMILK